MEAAREGHIDMVALLLDKGKLIIRLVKKSAGVQWFKHTIYPCVSLTFSMALRPNASYFPIYLLCLTPDNFTRPRECWHSFNQTIYLLDWIKNCVIFNTSDKT